MALDLVSLGELMLRLSPPGFERLRRARSFEIRPCGAQFNLAADFASLGKQARFLTRLPDNELGQLALHMAAVCGLDVSGVQLVQHPKIGLVFVEFSAAPRRPVHLYDRQGSAASLTTAADFDWSAAVLGQTNLPAHYAFTDGIFPALGPGCREATLAFLKTARRAGCRTCFDINYRPSLWQPGDAGRFYRQALPQVDILVTNRDACEHLLGYQGSDEALLRACAGEFGCSIVLLTYRQMQGLARGSWRSLAFQDGTVFSSREFTFEVVDQYGTGDAFFAGFLSAFQDSGEVQSALDFGGAMCALAHTVEGDQAIFSPGEVQAVLAEDYTLLARR